MKVEIEQQEEKTTTLYDIQEGEFFEMDNIIYLMAAQCRENCIYFLNVVTNSLVKLGRHDDILRTPVTRLELVSPLKLKRV